jgi:hypothetical protein
MGIRRLAVTVLLAPLMGGLVAAPVAAQQDASPPATDPANGEIERPPEVPGEPVCTITDWRLQELSGMVALDDDTFVVINNGGQVWDAQPIFFLNRECQVIDQIRYPALPRDPEDLAYDRERNILWVGDIGDNTVAGRAAGDPRGTVAFWRVDLAGDRIPVIHRFAYPDGAHDAEALILDSDGTPIIVTKAPGTASLYRPAAPMVPDNLPEQAVPLERIGEFSPPDTGADHALGRLARIAITGGATAPDGTRVVLRTYTDAFEFDITDGDVVAAITEGTPRITPLPGEPQGESITYSPDGQFFYTVSETAEFAGVNPVILRYTPTEPAPEPPPEEEVAPPPPSRSLLDRLVDRLGLRGIINVIGAVGIIGLLLVAVGIFGIVRARRLAADDEDEDYDEEGYDDDEGYDEDFVPYPDGGQGGGATARARVAPPPNGSDPGAHHGGAPPGGAVPGAHPGGAAQGWEQAPQPGVYTSGTVYGGAGQPSAAPPPDPGVAPPRGGTVYGASAGYQEHPFDQDHPDGYPEQPGAGYPGHGHSPQGYAQPQGQPEAGGVYGGGYQYGPEYGQQYQQPNPDEVPDYYYDDPDYPYEFRDR